MVKIEFYNEDKFVAVGECIEGSSHEDRDRIAMHLNVKEYDKIILDDGRVILTRNRSCYVIMGNKDMLPNDLISVWNIENVLLDTPEPENIKDDELE